MRRRCTAYTQSIRLYYRRILCEQIELTAAHTHTRDRLESMCLPLARARARARGHLSLSRPPSLPIPRLSRPRRAFAPSFGCRARRTQHLGFGGFKASHDVPEPWNCASAGRGRRDQRGEVARDEAGRARGGERRRMCTDVCAPREARRERSPYSRNHLDSLCRARVPFQLLVEGPGALKHVFVLVTCRVPDERLVEGRGAVERKS